MKYEHIKLLINFNACLMWKEHGNFPSDFSSTPSYNVTVI
jgi:hypothetical protein